MSDVISQFIVDDSIARDKLESLIQQLLPFCVIDRSGCVHFKKENLASKTRIKLVLSARLLASQLNQEITAEVTNEDLERSTGLPDNQVRARVKEVLTEKFAESVRRGSCKARLYKVETFLGTLQKDAA